MKTIVKRENRLPREIWVASLDLRGLWPEEKIEKRMSDILRRMEEFAPYEPEVICLPETFQTSWVKEADRKNKDEYAEDPYNPGPVITTISDVAKKQNCYVVCPIITKREGLYYNSSILIDRSGNVAGVYDKAHPTDGEILHGKITPGTLNPEVFTTDFGKVGMQICYDSNWWFDCWKHLKNQGAEIVFFSSQAPFTNSLTYHAWISQYYIISSTGEDARIIDISGDEVAVTGEFERWVCAPVNLEKVLIHIWPHVRKFDSIRKKYGRKIRIKIYHPENWATLESRDPDIKIKEILQEYEIPTYAEHLAKNEKVQDQYRE